MLEGKAGYQGSFPDPRIPELDSRDSIVTDEKQGFSSYLQSPHCQNPISSLVLSLLPFNLLVSICNPSLLKLTASQEECINENLAQINHTDISQSKF